MRNRCSSRPMVCSAAMREAMIRRYNLTSRASMPASAHSAAQSRCVDAKLSKSYWHLASVLIVRAVLMSAWITLSIVYTT